jgi:hypothetical protein
LLLALPSAVILRFDSRGTHEQILLSQIRDFPNLEGQVPASISSRKKVARLYARLSVPLSFPPTVRRAMVEVFDLASTQVLTY